MTTSGTLRLITGDKIKPVPVDWLWYPYIPRGSITIISASPGAGKTYLATWLAARITKGEEFPRNSDLNTPGNRKVVYLSREDDYSSTIVPRLTANGGDLSKFSCFPRKDIPRTFGDPRIEQILRQEQPDLIVFDALSSFIGGKVNANSFNEVRDALIPLQDALDGTRTAILIIAHNNKMTSEHSALMRVSGSVDITAAARSGLSVGRNPKDEEEIVLAQFKNSLAPEGESLAFEFAYEENPLSVPALRYKGMSALSADELLGGRKRRAPKLEQAKNAMRMYLMDRGGQALAKDVQEHLYSLEFSKSTVNRAKTALGVRHKTSREPKTGERNQTMWYIGKFPGSQE